jgi:catechol 2,3-dioxygenase-like lactoylglutathione lyase family enzyme
MASVRYIVDDVDAAVAFYTEHLGFEVQMRPAPTFAMLRRDDLRLLVSGAEGPGGGAQEVGGRKPEPGGWNRFQLEVSGLDEIMERLRAAGVPFRGEPVTGVAARQALVEDPAGNPVELFEMLESE